MMISVVKVDNEDKYMFYKLQVAKNDVMLWNEYYKDSNPELVINIKNIKIKPEFTHTDEAVVFPSFDTADMFRTWWGVREQYSDIFTLFSKKINEVNRHDLRMKNFLLDYATNTDRLMTLCKTNNKNIIYAYNQLIKHLKAAIESIPKSEPFEDDPMFLKQDPSKAHIDESNESTRIVKQNSDNIKIVVWQDKNRDYHRINGPAFIKKDDDGTVYKMYYNHGILHNKGGPAYIEIHPDGSYIYSWYTKGVRFNPDGPTWIHKTADEYVEHWYDEDERYHRMDGPALYAKNDKTIKKEWYIHGTRHNNNGPAYIMNSPTILIRTWYKYGLKHREDGPAEICIHKGIPSLRTSSGKDDTYEEAWYRKGVIHREDGPAYTQRLPDGRVNENWYLEGVRVLPSELNAFKDDPMFQKSNSSYVDESITNNVNSLFYFRRSI